MSHPHAKLSNDLRVDADRLWSRHMELARIGQVGETGSCRLALSQEDAEARSLFASWCLAAGMTLRSDRAGNMFAIRPGRSPSRKLVAAGSHLDTQPHGGRFDGISGVLAALEVIETLNDAGVETEAPLAVVNWTNEEGVSFAPGLLGSAWFAGQISNRDLDEITKPGEGKGSLTQRNESAGAAICCLKRFRSTHFSNCTLSKGRCSKTRARRSAW